MTKRWFQVALLNFFLAALIGAILRYAFVTELSWVKFRYWLHAHSHVAMLGWVYLGLFAMLVHQFLSPEQRQKKGYRQLFWMTEASVIGMLLSFPVQGYGTAAIIFSSMHVLLSYVFVFHFLKDLQKQGAEITPSRRFAVTALMFMVFSTLGLWVLGPVMALEWKQSTLYYMSVQFFLHFQFNGWFIFGVLALFFKRMEEQGLVFPVKQINYFYWLLVISCFLTYALALAWANPEQFVFWTNSLGVLLQLGAALFFARIINTYKEKIIKGLEGWSGMLLRLAFFCFLAKIIIQAAVVIPYIATVGYTIRNYVIGFLHLMLLGIVAVSLLSYAIKEGLLPAGSVLLKAGLIVFLTGFVLSESILFIQGTMFWGAMGFLPYYYEGLFAVSTLLPTGVGMILISTRHFVHNQKRP